MPDSLSATTTTTTNTPLGGSPACFPPHFTTPPLPLLLQNPAPPLSIMENPHPQGMTPDGRQSAITHRIL
ncbi:MAG: hypothetical protein JNJ78_22465 [Anaerolineae bacterium]|nr:hypothetical protein [Anaerolineae bacterium]